MSKQKNTTTNQEEKQYHPTLGYDLNAKLPYFLTNEDIYGTIPRADLAKLDKLDWMTPITVALNDFLQEGITQNYTGEIPTINEVTFVKSYLPYFYNGYSDDPSDGDFSVASAWIMNVSGHAYQHVDVVRDGIVIYRIPPLLGRLNVVGSKDREESIALMYKEMDDILQRVPNAKVHQINHFANNLFNPKDPNKDRKEFMTKVNVKFLYTLDEIFTYYGYPSILPEEFMKVKNIYMGNKHDSLSSGTVSNTPSSVKSSNQDWDDDELFG